MRTQSLLPGLVLSAALAAPAVSSAAERLNLNFTGVVSPGSFVAVDSNVEGEQGTHRTSFDGESVNIALSLQRHGGGYYVEHFEISWTDEAYDYPFLLGWNGDGFPYPPDAGPSDGFASTVNLTSSGGAISIFPTHNYHGDYNSSFDLNLSFVTDQPYDPALSFPTMAVSGGGDIDAYSADYFWVPGDGPYAYFPPDFSGERDYFEGLSRFNFTVTSMSQTAVPEPSAWLLMIAGFAAVGAMTRRHAALARQA